MLAQTFKTAEDLKLTPQQYDALHQVLVLLETDQITYVPLRWLETDQITYHLKPQYSFNMQWWKGEFNTCGTVACIGGTAEILAKESLFFSGSQKMLSRALENLFYPNGDGDLAHITPEQAARALRNYLTTGWPRWREVLRQK